MRKNHTGEVRKFLFISKLFVLFCFDTLFDIVLKKCQIAPREWFDSGELIFRFIPLKQADFH